MDRARVLHSLCVLIACLAPAILVGCGGSTSSTPHNPYLMFAGGGEGPVEPGEVPNWITGSVLEKGKLCGFGVAGAGRDPSSPYPKQMAEERAIKNLAGVLGTRVQEVIIDKMTNRGTAVRQAKAVTVDEALVERVRAISKTEFWLDRAAQGPFAAKDFTYARTCVDAKLAATELQLSEADLASAGPNTISRPHVIPRWIKSYGIQKDGRLCAVGFSLPTFHPDKTLDNVVEDIRWQLAEVLHTFVSSYYEELTTTRSQTFEAMTLATTQAVSKGAVVTDYWYDRDGIGPVGKKRSTYGYGCVYPVDVLQSSATVVEKTAPEEEKNVIARVRQRAADAFDALDAEIDKQQRAAAPPASAKGAEEAPQEEGASPAPAPGQREPAVQPEPELEVEEPGHEALPATSAADASP